MPENARFDMELPSTSDPEGILVYVIVLVLVASLALLALFATGLWTAT
jgi:hypothetical protein